MSVPCPGTNSLLCEESWQVSGVRQTVSGVLPVGVLVVRVRHLHTPFHGRCVFYQLPFEAGGIHMGR